MNMATDRERVLTIVKQDLPLLIEQDREIRSAVSRLLGSSIAPALERIDRVLEELRRDREESTRRWDEGQRALAVTREDQDRKWDEGNARWNKVHDEIMAFERIQSSITAIGARLGMHSESAWRNGLRAILETDFGVKVENVVEFDEKGEVFGRADQIELDVVIYDGRMILIELKSSLSRPDMYVFERKIRFTERFSGRKADRYIVVSPMVDPRALEIARSFHIECYSHTLDIPTF
jgi:hypothetical protein